ncbi:hypothetical protein VCHA54P496_20394 [Vibrio chagasii]|nr:hypothetical protein VCHA54P495_20394 [Vibrio chagasii]CAH7220349.1 hypothetical protein VCHA54P496_20394 [Vibrio chagasii]
MPLLSNGFSDLLSQSAMYRLAVTQYLYLVESELVSLLIFLYSFLIASVRQGTANSLFESHST